MATLNTLFSELNIAGKTMKNRIALSPMGEGMTNDEGTITDQYKAYYLERARGGVGMVTLGYLGVDYPNGRGSFQVRVDNDLNIEDLSDLTNSCKKYGAMVIGQLHHAGAQSNAMATKGMEPLTPSDIDCGHIMVQGMRTLGPQHELTTEEIYVIRDKFIQGAVTCQKAGLDGVSLHGGHGYLLSEFLSPNMNVRTDQYGGSTENRARLVVEIIEGIRKACGPDFIIGARIPGKEFVEGGLTDDECIEIAKMCEAAGCDFLDITVGAINAFSRMIETEKYPQGSRIPYAERIKAAVNIPVGASGTLRDPEFCESVIAEGKVDFVLLGRALICDPYWPAKAEEGRLDDIRKCLSCSEGCMRRVMDGLFATCVLNPVTGRELELGNIEAAPVSKKVAIVGGGIAGMQAALVAKKRGHEVTILEKSPVLGGQLNLACIPPSKERIKQAVEWFAGQIKKNDITVKLNTEATLDLINDMNPDEIIFAAGATPVTNLPIEGIENAVQAWDMIGGDAEMPSGKNIAVVGGGIVACELTEMLLDAGNHVTMIEMLPQIASGLEMMHLFDLMGEFAMRGVDTKVNATVKKIGKDTVTFTQDDNDITLDTDCTVLAVGQKPFGKELAEELKTAGYNVQVIGDANKAAKIQDATLAAYEAALAI